MAKIRCVTWMFLVTITLAPLSVLQAKGRAESSRLIDGILACGDVADVMVRVACFDDHVKALRIARANDEKSFVDKRIVEETRPEFRELNSIVVSVASLEHGKWLIVLTDNSVWQNFEGTWSMPARGDKARIRKGALGSYLADVGQIIGARLKRLR